MLVRKLQLMIRWGAVALCLMLHPGCGLLPDPATGLAYCVEEAIRKHAGNASATRATCDLENPGRHLVVLHPPGPLRESELAAAGVTPDLLDEMRVLRIGVQPAIFVIATDPGVTGTGTDRSTLSQWTTYQNNFVQIDKLMVLAGNTQPVVVDIGGPPERRVIEGIH
jgi:hypothetical protein